MKTFTDVQTLSAALIDVGLLDFSVFLLHTKLSTEQGDEMRGRLQSASVNETGLLGCVHVSDYLLTFIKNRKADKLEVYSKLISVEVYKITFAVLILIVLCSSCMFLC